MLNLLIGPITSIVSDVLRRVLPPEKISEKDRVQLELDAQKIAIELYTSQYAKEFEDRISARELAKEELDKGNALTNVLAATHRPLWSFILLFVFVWTMISPQLGLPAITLTDIHKDIMQTVIVFYFGGRSAEKIVTTIKGGK